MSRLRLLGYGARLAVAGGGATRLRIALMAGGMAVGVAMLLGLFSVLPAVSAHQARVQARQPSGLAQPTRSGAHVWGFSGLYRGHLMTTTSVFVDGPVRGAPAGLTRLPGPGEVVVSPALARLLDGPNRGELAARLPGRVVATIGPAGLLGPGELMAWVGVSADPTPSVGGQPTAVRGFGNPGPAEAPVYMSSGDKLALGLAFVGLLVPVLVLIATLTRLSAAARERRLAAIRLVGATRRQTRWLAAAETGVAAAAGAVGGLGVFYLLRAPLAALVPTRNGVFATDIAPPVALTILVLVGVPVLAVTTAVLALRRVVTSPLGVTRRAAPRRVGWWRLVPLTVGMLMLLGAWYDRHNLLTGGTRGAVLLLGGASLSLIGLAVAAAAVARLGGLLLHRFGPGTASQLAGRRLEADPAAAARVLTGAMLVVAVVGWLLGFLPLLDASQGGGNFDIRDEALRPGTLTMQVAPQDPIHGDATASVLNRVPGVTAVATTQQLTISADSSQADADVALVADCADLRRVTRRPLTECGRAPAYRIVHEFADDGRHARPGETWQIMAQDKPSGAVVRMPSRLPAIRLPAGINDITWGNLLVSPKLIATALPAGATLDPNTEQYLFIATDGQPATAERVRSAVWRNTLFDKPMTIREQQAVQLGMTSDLYRRAALAGVIFALVAAALSLAVTMADSLRERRRGLAALVALGTPVRVLRRSLLLQTAVPLLLNIALATGASIAATVLYLRLDSDDGGYRVSLPWAGWSLMAAATVAAVLLATALTLPFIRAAARPDALRSE
ncbi:MAG: hypothetical protein QOH75_1221 [Actinomycetota bacterium]|nr:hypothetical protein [Actinomycetota bacterium]